MKNNKSMLLILLLAIMLVPFNVDAALGFCAKTATIWQIVGWVFLIIKILVPILLIIFGIIDMAKSVMSSKPEEVTKSAKSLAFRAIAGVAIFFIPTIVAVLMGIVSSFTESEASDDYLTCQSCILNPSSCDTSQDAGKTK